MSKMFPLPVFQFVNSAGQPYAGGSLTFYLTSTSSPQDTFSNEGLSAANTNPVTLNSAGWPATDIFLSPGVKYKVILKDSAGNTIWTKDPVSTTDFAVVPLWSTRAGNPNGSVAGTAASSGVLPSIVWDRTNNIMYVCVTTGAAATAVWTAINPDTTELVWTIADRVSAAPGAAAEGTSYIVASSFGSFVTGQIITDNGTGEFTVTQPPTDCGWIAWVQDEDRYYAFKATAWVDILNPIRSTDLPTGTHVNRAYGSYATSTTISTVIPYDDSIPQNTEGTEIITAAITLASATNRVRVRFQGSGGCVSSTDDDGRPWCAALFINTTADALAATASGPVTNNVLSSRAGGMTPCTIEFEHAPGTVGPHTYKIRVGPSEDEMLMNGDAAARKFGGVSVATLVLEEIVAS